MSPSVGNFVHDLVEMAKAMETLPAVQRELDEVRHLNDKQGEVIASREETILKLKQEIEALNEKVRQSEVARDTAETMFLETDDKLAAFRRLVEAFGKDTQSLIAAQEPPKPEPQPEPIYSGEGWGSSAIPPTSAPPAPTGTGTESVASSSEQGQGAANPIHGSNTADGAQTASAPTAEHSTAVHTPQEPSTAQAAEPVRLEPYAGKRYSEHPVYVPLSAWVEGGGTEADYYR